MTENPRIQQDQDGTLDDFCAKNVALVHFEALSEAEWYATIQLDTGEVYQLFFGAKNRAAKGFARVEGLGVYPAQGKLV